MAAPKTSSRRSVGARLTGKVGPLPVWAWALLILVTGYIIYRVRGGTSTSSTSTTSTDQTGTGDVTAPTTDLQTSGNPGPDTATGSPDVASLNDSVLSQLGGFQSSLDSLTMAVLSSSAFVPGAGDSGSGSQVPNGTPTPSPAGTARTVESTTAPARPAPAHSAPAHLTFYTYAPGKAPKGRKQQEAPARGPAGTKLHFARGRGYYYS